MDESRKLRKRELDRKAQRLARERTKNRISELEAMVAQLQQNDSNAQVASLMSQLFRTTKERDKALDVLRSLRTTITRQLNDAPVNKAPSTSSSPGADASGGAAHESALATELWTEGGLATNSDQNQASGTLTWPIHPWSTSSMIPIDSPGRFNGMLPNDTAPCNLDGISHGQIAPLSSLDLSHDSMSDDDVIVPQAPTACHCTASGLSQNGIVKPFNKWRGANEALGKAIRLSAAEIMTEDLTSQDTPVRAIIEGWDSVEKAGKMTKSWRKLRKVDEVCFQKCSPVERLAILRMMHITMVYHCDPTTRQSTLPHWLLMRPSQSIVHSHAIDYFVWPGIRERFVFSQHRYCTNIFWDLFASNFKVTWPFDFRDTYMKNSETGQLQLSPMFEDRLRDISSWTMCNDFFTTFPELYGDIPANLSIPPNISGASRVLSNPPESENGLTREEMGRSIHLDMQL